MPGWYFLHTQTGYLPGGDPPHWKGLGLGIGCMGQWHTGVLLICLLCPVDLWCVWVPYRKGWGKDISVQLLQLHQWANTAAKYAIEFRCWQHRVDGIILSIGKDWALHYKVKWPVKKTKPCPYCNESPWPSVWNLICRQNPSLQNQTTYHYGESSTTNLVTTAPPALRNPDNGLPSWAWIHVHYSMFSISHNITCATTLC